MKKSIGGLIALALSVAMSVAYAAIPDGDGISSGSPPGLIASTTSVLAGVTTPTIALVSVAMGTKGDSPALMAGIKTSSPALASIGGGSGDSKVDTSWAQAQTSPGGGFALLAREDEKIGIGSPPGLLASIGIGTGSQRPGI